MYVCMYVCMCVCVYVCMYVCLYVFMFVCLYVCMSVCLYVCLSVCMYVCMSVCLYVCMSVCMYLCIYASMHLCIYVSIYLCIYLCIYLSIYVSIYLCMYVYEYTHIYICINMYLVYFLKPISLVSSTKCSHSLGSTMCLTKFICLCFMVQVLYVHSTEPDFSSKITQNQIKTMRIAQEKQFHICSYLSYFAALPPRHFFHGILVPVSFRSQVTNRDGSPRSVRRTSTSSASLSLGGGGALRLCHS